MKNKEYSIGNLKLESRIFLAPMAEINDIAFRILCKKAGCGLVYTGMLNPLSQEKLQLYDKPAMQLFSTSKEGIKDFMKKYEKEVQLFDFNLGCPKKNARENGYGAYLQKRKSEIEEILQEMRNSTKKPITIKLRKTDEALEIVKIAEKYCDAICIHPRTPSQGYSGIPDLSFAEEIKRRTKLPVIYSGNVNEKNAEELLKTFDFLMIGREAIGDPNIFLRLQDKKDKFDFFDYLKFGEKYKISFVQIKKQAMNFTKKKFGARKIRAELVKSKTIEDIKRIMKEV